MKLLYVTCEDKGEARDIATSLLKEKLIACANFFAIDSVYMWNDEYVHGNEYVVILKTFPELVSRAKEMVEKIHSYDCPCIIELDASVNAPYEQWMREATGLQEGTKE